MVGSGSMPTLVQWVAQPGLVGSRGRRVHRPWEWGFVSSGEAAVSSGHLLLKGTLEQLHGGTEGCPVMCLRPRLLF